MGACAAGVSLPDVFIDLSSAAAGDDEESRVVDDIKNRVLSPSGELLPRFAAYQDCQGVITVAISNASPENVDAAWAAALPNVQFQAELFDFALVLVERFQSLVNYVTGQGGKDALSVFSRHHLAAKTFADFYDIILKFDETISTLPRLLGDLSFFRRNASRHPDCDQLYAKSNEMSMFFAIPSPLLSKTLSGISASARSPPDVAKMLDVFGSLADLFTSAMVNHRSDNREVTLLYMRGIVGALLCYDSIAPAGAFHAKAGVQALTAIETIASETPKPTGLLNLIKYGSKHYKEPTTLKGITMLVG
jgi:hypothetical protein